MKNLFSLWTVVLTIMLLSSCSDNLNDTPQNIELEKTTKTSNIKTISKNDAINIASQFAKTQGILPPGTRGNEDLQIVYTDLDMPTTRSSNNDTPSYYIINIGNNGYIIVSGVDATLPVLGYSTEGTFNNKNIPLSMKEVLTNYQHEIKYIKQHNLKPDEISIQKRKAFLSNTLNTKVGSSVQPLLGDIKWSQKPYYNAYCPQNTPVGCVATATAQIMRFWEYPNQGEGKHSYKTSFGTLSFDYNYKLNLKDMPKKRLRQSNDDIAKLCYGIAVGLDTEFSAKGSSAWQEKVPALLTKHFQYPATMKNKYREDYTTEEWEETIKYELDAGRPVQYVGYSNAGGHSFVCDGYDSNGYFHFNWGWGGTSDGYFLLHALNPSMLKNNTGFNLAQAIITGIQAPKNTKASTEETNNNTSDNYTNNNYPESKAMFAITTFIKNVTLSNIDNVTLSNNGGYNYFANQTAKLKTGKSYKLSLAPGSTKGYYTEYWRAWIDFNHNGTFEENEKVAEGITRDFKSLTKKIKINKNTYKGTTRMRVSMKWGSFPSSNETFRHGEVEDYNIEIQ